MIDRWYGVSCLCGSTAEIMPTIAEAVAKAKAAGWFEVRPAPRSGSGLLGRIRPDDIDHVCPDCLAKVARMTHPEVA